MHCESCGDKPATIHTTDVVNKTKTERHLCESCYQKCGAALPFSENNLAGFTTKSVAKAGLQLLHNLTRIPRGPVSECPHCGLSLTEFQKRGTLGCRHCYDAFEDHLSHLLAKLHGATEHVGRLPTDFHARRAREHQMAQLEGDLKRAVDAERYEEAASLRDRIQALHDGSPEDASIERQDG